jgi:hypothetical protein
MKSKTIAVLVGAVIFVLSQATVFAHGGEKHVKLHVNPRWEECSFQLDAALTQEAWREFTREAGMTAYFRPLTVAKPMGRGNYEFSILQWETAIDDTKDAWNDTFVHPDSTHWLKDGDRLPFPGLTFRAGITNRLDVGVYFTKNPKANYGFLGGQVQYNLVNDMERKWAASTRISFTSLYGPEDLDLRIFGIDVLASKEFDVYSDRIAVTPYAGVSTYLSSSHEKSDVVNLKDENITGLQAMIGAVAQVYVARLAVEYNFAVVNSLSFKLGIGF